MNTKRKRRLCTMLNLNFTCKAVNLLMNFHVIQLCIQNTCKNVNQTSADGEGARERESKCTARSDRHVFSSPHQNMCTNKKKKKKTKREIKTKRNERSSTLCVTRRWRRGAEQRSINTIRCTDSHIYFNCRTSNEPNRCRVAVD